MLQGHHIVCFSSDWNQDPLSKHHIMRRLSEGNRILWVNSIGLRTPTISTADAGRVIRKLKSFFKGDKKVSENLFVVSPIAIPFHGAPFVPTLNKIILRMQLRRFARKYDIVNPIFWTFFPNTAGLLGQFREKLSIYYITDDFGAFTGHPGEALDRMERELVDKCDLVFATSTKLVEKKARPGKPIHLIRHGVQHAHFASALTFPRDRLPDDIKNIPGPVVGFYGEINDWLDLPMLAEAARKKPAWSFVLIGRVAVEVGDIGFLKQLPNVYLLGQKPFSALPAYCSVFDAGLILRKINELTLSMNPLKLREYLAAGVPVISPHLPEVEPYADVVRFASTADELIAAFEEILRHDRKEIGPRLSKRVEPDGWNGRVEEISRIVEKALEKRAKERL
jgi:glycosyltransferase involved in cell wall biosynthesis